MRAVMPALQRAKPVKLAGQGVAFASVTVPRQQRETKVIRDMSVDRVASELAAWIKE
jgi:electron transfer flavoprotein beta subunit